MKKYTNMTGELRCVRFQDGTTQFLTRGQSFESDKPTAKVQPGIRESDVRKIKRPVSQVDATESTEK